MMVNIKKKQETVREFLKNGKIQNQNKIDMYFQFEKILLVLISVT